MHFAIRVETKAGTVRSTHQLGMAGTKTLIDKFDPAGRDDLEVIKIKVPNPRAAIDYQDRLIKAADRQIAEANYDLEQLATPEYDVVTQSCLTHVFDVLRAAGISDAPLHSDPKNRATKHYMIGLKRKSKEDFPHE